MDGNEDGASPLPSRTQSPNPPDEPSSNLSKAVASLIAANPGKTTGFINLRATARSYHVPKSTLNRHASRAAKGGAIAKTERRRRSQPSPIGHQSLPHPPSTASNPASQQEDVTPQSAVALDAHQTTFPSMVPFPASAADLRASPDKLPQQPLQGEITPNQTTRLAGSAHHPSARLRAKPSLQTHVHQAMHDTPTNLTHTPPVTPKNTIPRPQQPPAAPHQLRRPTMYGPITSLPASGPLLPRASSLGRVYSAEEVAEARAIVASHDANRYSPMPRKGQLRLRDDDEQLTPRSRSLPMTISHANDPSVHSIRPDDQSAIASYMHSPSSSEKQGPSPLGVREGKVLKPRSRQEAKNEKDQEKQERLRLAAKELVDHNEGKLDSVTGLRRIADKYQVSKSTLSRRAQDLASGLVQRRKVGRPRTRGDNEVPSQLSRPSSLGRSPSPVQTLRETVQSPAEDSTNDAVMEALGAEADQDTGSLRHDRSPTSFLMSINQTPPSALIPPAASGQPSMSYQVPAAQLQSAQSTEITCLTTIERIMQDRLSPSEKIDWIAQTIAHCRSISMGL